MSRFLSLLPLLCSLAVVSCGDLPRPFEGNPGATARRLSQPPPARLAVPAPQNALLSNDSGQALSAAVADALVEQSVPAVAGPAKPGDWRLLVTARLNGSMVVPSYTVQTPTGTSEGSTDGNPVPAAVWSNGNQATIKQAAVSAAPAIAALLTTIEAAIQESDPNSLVNRPARIQFTGVTGAPGDGNTALARQVRNDLNQLGILTQDTPANADFALACQVTTAPGSKGTTRIELQWIVNDPDGHERGRVVQINEIAPGSLDHYWGDVAVVVAQEAAGGVRQVIVNQTAAGHLHGDQPAKTATP
jgi:hypothetical protein